MRRSTFLLFRKSNRFFRHFLCTATALILVLSLAACDENSGDLCLQDLTPAERLYIERIIVLERAKAVALVDRATGDVVLDSLALAWGDSSLSETKASGPRDPERATAVNTLLRDILTAERDSLLATSGTSYLAAPIIDPPEPNPKTTEK